MRRILLLIFWQFGLLTGGRLFADVVTLKDGRQISGPVESGNIQELHIKVGDQSQTIDIHDVQAIQFGVSLPAPPAAPPPLKAADLAPELAPAAAEPTLQAGAPPRAAPQPPTSAPAGIMAPGIGAEIAVGAADSTDSRKASLDDPITLDGVEAAPANANDFPPVTEVKSGLTGCSKIEASAVESRAGAVALTFAGEPIGNGLKNAPETPFTNRLTQPAFLNSKRGCQ